MPQPFRNHKGLRPKFGNQEACVGVAEVMQTHLFNASRFYPPQHFTCHIAFGTVENPVIRHNPIQHTRLLF
jgi:hypothetical protein